MEKMGDETFKERQENEFEVLKSIFMDDLYDCRVDDAWKVYRPPEIRLKLKPQQSMHGDQIAHVEVDLCIKCQDDYPHSVPEMWIENEKGLSKENVVYLLSELSSLASVLRGEVMILELADRVRHVLHTNNKPKFTSFYEEMISNHKKQEEEFAKEREKTKNKIRAENEKQMLAIQEEILKKQEQMRQESRRRRSTSLNILDDVNDEHKENDRTKEQSPIAEQNIRPRYTAGNNCKVHKDTSVIKFNQGSSEIRSIRRGKCIDHGCYGDVSYIGIDINSGEMFLVTEWSIVLRNVPKKLNPNDQDVVDCFNQLNVVEQDMMSMRKLNHPGLLKYVCIKYYLEKNKIIVYVLKEFTSGGTLTHYLVNKIPVEHLLLQKIAAGILSILVYLHDNSIVHKDLSDACIYVEESGLVKISNYSVYKRLIELISQHDKDIKTDDKYPLSLGRGGKKCDVYRLGLIMLSLAQGSIVTDMIPTIPSSLPVTFRDFLSRCLMKDEQERWSASQLLQHAFIIPSSSDAADNDKDDVIDDCHAGNLQDCNKFVNDKSQIFSTLAILPSLNNITGSSTTQSRINEEFQVLEWLGKGGFGDVLKVKNKLDGGVYAIKRILLNPSNKILNKKITREVKLLSRLNHENVVRYYNSWIETRYEEGNAVDKDDTSSNVTTPSTSTPSFDRSKPSFGLGITDDFEKLAPPVLDVSVEWTVSSHHQAINDDNTSSDDDDDDDEDVFGMSLSLPSESSDVVTFEDDAKSKDKNSEAVSPSYDLSSRQGVGDLVEKQQKIIQYMFIQMEFCENSTLRTAIDDKLYKDKDRMWRLFREIIEGLVHIHQQGMIHRDLKPVNIFLDSNDHVKIGDFGLATTDIRVRSSLLDGNVACAVEQLEISHSENQLTGDGGGLTGHVGTALYVAPELSTSVELKAIYNQKVDIYSLGIIFFEMCYPLLSTGMERVKVLANLRTKDIKMPAECDVHLLNAEAELIRWILNHDQNLRPTSQELLQSKLLPPPQIEETRLNEHFKQTINNPQSKAYKHMIFNLFKQQMSLAADFTYDINTFARSTSSVATSLAFHNVRRTLERIFHKHGAVQLSTPLLLPQTQQNYTGVSSSIVTDDQSNNVNMMDRGGNIVTLPKDLRVPFARAVARRDLCNIKRYSIDRVYRERKVFGAHPRELTECTFDIVTNTPASLIPEAEVLAVMSEIIREFPQLQRRNYILRLNHVSLLKAVLMHCGIDEEKHYIVHTILKEAEEGTNKYDVYTKLENLGISDHQISLLQTFIDTEDTFNKVSNMLKPISKRKGQISSFVKQGLHEIEATVNHAEALGFDLPIVINPTLVYEIEQFSGIFFQFICELKRKRRKPTMDVLAAGGRYDSLVSSFRLFPTTSAPACKDNFSTSHAVGVSIAVDKLVSCVSEALSSEGSVGLVDVIVCCSGHKTMLREMCNVVRDLWSAGVSAIIQYDITQTHDIHEMCKDNGISYMVILKDSESGYISVRSIEKDRFSEKKLNSIDLIDYIVTSLNSKSNYCDQITAIGTVKTEMVKSSGTTGEKTSSGAGELTSTSTLSNLNITYLIASDKQKWNQAAKRRYELQISSNLSSLLQNISSKTNVEVLALDLPLNVIRTIVSYVQLTTDEKELEASVTSIIERHQRYKKYLMKVCDEIQNLLYSRRCPVIVLYSINESAYKVII